MARTDGPGNEERAPQPAFPAEYGFCPHPEGGWRRDFAGISVRFRILRSLEELFQAEALQEEVFGVSERDLIPANELIVVAETGGAVIGAFLDSAPDRAAAVVVGWGGFVGHPRIVSDFLAVRPESRNLGLAAELKRLQAAIALQRGFVEIVWTVDPLRAANARLNFGKLGATGVAYEIDRYGSTFATGLYGGMPTDRLHIRWDLADPAVAGFLRRLEPVRPRLHSTREYAPGATEQHVHVSIPEDIDELVAADPATAIMWRTKTRAQLMSALDEGFTIVGFTHATAFAGPRLLLTREL